VVRQAFGRYRCAARQALKRAAATSRRRCVPLKRAARAKQQSKICSPHHSWSRYCRATYRQKSASNSAGVCHHGTPAAQDAPFYMPTRRCHAPHTGVQTLAPYAFASVCLSLHRRDAEHSVCRHIRSKDSSPPSTATEEMQTLCTAFAGRQMAEQFIQGSL